MRAMVTTPSTGGRLDQLFGGAGTNTSRRSPNFNGAVAGSATPITLIFDASGSGTASDGTFITGFDGLLLNLSDTGNNVVDTGNVSASITSGAGDDRLTTGAGDDILFGGDGNDTLAAGDGNNQIAGVLATTSSRPDRATIASASPSRPMGRTR
ncbi:calcium-binding protein [Sphingomonas sp. MMS24-JH45]